MFSGADVDYVPDEEGDVDEEEVLVEKQPEVDSYFVLLAVLLISVIVGTLVYVLSELFWYLL